MARPLKIGITCYPSVGGSGILASALGEELARRGDEVHFIGYERPFRLPAAAPRLFFHPVVINDYGLFKYPDYTLPLSVKMAEVEPRPSPGCAPCPLRRAARHRRHSGPRHAAAANNSRAWSRLCTAPTPPCSGAIPVTPRHPPRPGLLGRHHHRLRPTCAGKRRTCWASRSPLMSYIISSSRARPGVRARRPGANWACAMRRCSFTPPISARPNALTCLLETAARIRPRQSFKLRHPGRRQLCALRGRSAPARFGRPRDRARKGQRHRGLPAGGRPRPFHLGTGDFLPEHFGGDVFCLSERRHGGSGEFRKWWKTTSAGCWSLLATSKAMAAAVEDIDARSRPPPRNGPGRAEARARVVFRRRNRAALPATLPPRLCRMMGGFWNSPVKAIQAPPPTWPAASRRASRSTGRRR